MIGKNGRPRSISLICNYPPPRSTHFPLQNTDSDNIAPNLSLSFPPRSHFFPLFFPSLSTPCIFHLPFLAVSLESLRQFGGRRVDLKDFVADPRYSASGAGKLDDFGGFLVWDSGEFLQWLIYASFKQFFAVLIFF